jgi:proline dehydrogenase
LPVGTGARVPFTGHRAGRSGAAGMALMRNAILWASNNEWLRRHVPRWRFVRAATSRFMPGETLEEALHAAKDFLGRGLPTTLTHLGENVGGEEEARGVVEHYLHVLDQVHAYGLDTEVSVKPTHLGLELGEDLAFGNLERIVARAGELGTWVWIDMEASPHVQGTLEIYRRALGTSHDVGLCLQAYLYRTAADLEELLPLGPSVRLVKGAYREDPDICYQKKDQIDRNFVEVSARILDAVREGAVRRFAAATHDLSLIERIGESARATEMGDDAFEVQMLYGIRQREQFRLVERGVPTRSLIAYGPAWYPWYMRRLAERPANVLFVLRNLFNRRPVPALSR